jgi:hypothetical protein
MIRAGIVKSSDRYVERTMIKADWIYSRKSEAGGRGVVNVMGLRAHKSFIMLSG